MADRYCTNCHQELSPEGSFCPNCGRSIHQKIARVSTPEADVTVPPPSPPTPPPQLPPRETADESVGAAGPLHQRSRWSDPAVVLLIGAFVLLGVMRFARDFASAGGTFAFKVGFAIVGALASVLVAAIIAIAVMLVGGLVVYLLEGGGTSGAKSTFLQAVLSRQVLVVGAVVVVLIALT